MGGDTPPRNPPTSTHLSRFNVGGDRRLTAQNRIRVREKLQQTNLYYDRDYRVGGWGEGVVRGG